MRAWVDRSIEEANLLNPAFLSILVQESVTGFTFEKEEEAPYILPFLVLPMVLHKKTRIALPETTRTVFASWMSKREGTQAKAGYPERTQSLCPYVKEALIFSLGNGIVSVNENGALQTPLAKAMVKKASWELTREVEECIWRSFFCGRWFSRVGKIETVMTLLGVKP